MKKEILLLKPHHFIAFFRDLGSGEDPGRYTNDNDYKKAFDLVLKSSDLIIELTIGVDFICRPCKFLGKDNKCTHTIRGHGPEQPLQEWAERIDSRLFKLLELKEGTQIKNRELCSLCIDKLGDLKRIFLEEPDDRRNQRAQNLNKGFTKYLNIR